MNEGGVKEISASVGSRVVQQRWVSGKNGPPQVRRPLQQLSMRHVRCGNQCDDVRGGRGQSTTTSIHRHVRCCRYILARFILHPGWAVSPATRSCRRRRRNQTLLHSRKPKIPPPHPKVTRNCSYQLNTFLSFPLLSTCLLSLHLYLYVRLFFLFILIIIIFVVVASQTPLKGKCCILIIIL